MADDTRYTPPTAQERLHEHGPRVLSDVELLTILLGPTAGSNSTREAAQRLLDAAPLAELAWASPDALTQHDGVGPARAAAIVAAFELGRRGAWSPPRRGDRLLEPARVHELLRHAGYAETEHFLAVLLDVRGRLIKTVQVSQGSLNSCPVDPRDVMREAIRANAAGLVLAHCHPSGSIEPSDADVALTDRLRVAGDLIGIRVHDHLILGGDRYFSFVEAGRWRR
jgi:DNA repair protein RadC